ncbi:MAG: hypothetical protein M3004_12455 [Bacteroidota bacterium]|nr:hypothetical protein [Bacteroidota bacterium]
MFQKHLVDINSSVEVKNNGNSNEINFFGGNKRGILLLINNTEDPFLNNEQFTFLGGILNACKLSMEDICLINLNKYSLTSYKKITETFATKIIVMFGITSDMIQLPFIIPAFQSQTFNKTVYLSAPSLDELENNKDLKRKLWASLQQIFSL